MSVFHRRASTIQRVLVLVAVVAVAGWGFSFFSLWSSHGTQASSSAQAASPTEATPSTVSQRVGLSEEQLKNIEIRAVTEQTVPMHLAVNGRIGFNEDQTVPILAPIAGHVINVKARVGNQVHTGEALFCLKSREIAAMESEYQDSRKDLDLATKTHASTLEMFKSKAASNIALQQSENDLSKAKTRVLRCEEQLRVLGLDPAELERSSSLQPIITIRAPRDGTIVERHATEGQFVQGDGTPLFLLSDLSSVWVLADVFERDLHAIRLNQPAEVTTLAYPNERFAGQVTHISNTVDPLTRTVKVRLLVANIDGRLKPEMFAGVSLVLEEAARSLVVSDHAVITDDGKTCVFVRIGPREFIKRTVQVESAGPGLVRVLHGLKAGEEIVTQGPLMLRNIEQAPAQADG